MDLEKLNADLLAAHARDDKPALVRLYHTAGDHLLSLGDIDAGCFYLTHAYIFALDCGDKFAAEIHQTLVAHGREK
jgi:hypothetical protein